MINVRKITVVVLIMTLALVCVLAAGCGGSGGSSRSDGSEAETQEKEYIEVGEFAMKPEKWTKEGSDDGSQGLSFLIMGEKIPVTMSMDGSGTQAGFQVKLIDGDTSYSATQVTYNKVDEGAYGIRAIFYFPDLPEGELPSQAEVTLTSGEQATATADLTGIPEE